jgi:hypothetical protein
MHRVAYVVFAMLRKSVWFVRVSSSLVLYVKGFSPNLCKFNSLIALLIRFILVKL